MIRLFADAAHRDLAQPVEGVILRGQLAITCPYGSSPDRTTWLPLVRKEQPPKAVAYLKILAASRDERQPS